MEQRMTGTFYGVSVGPGNPELLTLQAVRLLRQCPVLAAPQTASGQMLALDIARRALGAELDGKTILPLQFAMSRDAAVVYKATWPEQKTVRCTVGSLAQSVHDAGITKTALIVAGDFLGTRYERSKLYDPGFTTEFRKGSDQ